MRINRSFCLITLLFAGMPALAQETGKRVALIIGNNNYTTSPLKNAISDARAMDKALQSAGFRTILQVDATQAVMEESAAEFLRQLGPDDTALFFYAGHGVQISNENFLVPVDFQPGSSVITAKFRCFQMARLLEELKNRPKRTIIILDACRSNPLAQSNALEAGLAQPQNAGKETYIAYSTGPGQVAADNPNGRNSWFTEALAELVDQPGLTLDDVFTRVKSRVSSETEKHQAPWTISSLTSTFYFHAPANLKAENDPSLAEKWTLEAQRREQRQDWQRAIELLNQVLARKPGGALEANAASRLPYLTARKEARKLYTAGDFKAAAAEYERALTLDPFSIDAAFEAAGNYLLSEQVPEAVRLLAAARVRGASTSMLKANAMLKELGTIYPAAGEVLKGGIPDPPPIQELFNSVSFDTPDWNAGLRFMRSAQVALTESIKALEAAYPPPPPPEPAAEISTTGGAAEPAPSASTSPAAPATAQFFHVEVVPAGDTRDISIRRLADQNEPTGLLVLDGAPGQITVMLNGSVVGQQLPSLLKLPAGKYQVRGVQNGQVLSSQDVEVKAQGTHPVKVPEHN